MTVNSLGSAPDISADGRYVVFASSTNDLVAGDTTSSDLYLADRSSGTLRKAVTDADGGEANGWTEYAALSADGRFLAFASPADDLVTGRDPVQADVLLRRLPMGDDRGCTVTAPVNGAYRGTAGDDVICAGTGDDVVWANGGDDVVYGGDGNDVVWGMGGNDRLYGEGGDDHLRGVVGADLVDGGDGHDTLEGGHGHDDLFGGNGDDRLVNQTATSSQPGDDLFGEAGDDVLDFCTPPVGIRALADGGAGTDTVLCATAAIEMVRVEVLG
jgi:Ca2+-binding RTX toxin-like protein